MLRIALLGAGRIGRMHARNLAAHPRTRLAGVYDIDRGAAAEAAAEAGSRPFANLDPLLGDSSIDAVLIASSTDTHCELIERSVRAGKAVLCEKPIDLDIARVDRCRKVVSDAGRPVQIGFNRRFDPSHGALQAAVAAGEIGRLETAVITSRDPAPPPYEYLLVSGGIFRDMTIHDFDMARFVFGEEPVEVSAMGGNLFHAPAERAGDWDTATVLLRMRSGALCHINCSRRCAYGYDQRVEAFGEKGMLASGNPTPTSLSRHSAAGTSMRDPLHHFFIERYAESYIREIDAFADSVEADAPPCPGFEDGRRALLLANAALEAARTGGTVRLPD